MAVHQTTVRECPACGARLGAATGVTDDDAPVAGDLSVCFYCACPLMFTDDGLRVLTAEETARFEAESPEYRAARAAVLAKIAADAGDDTGGR